MATDIYGAGCRQGFAGPPRSTRWCYRSLGNQTTAPDARCARKAQDQPSGRLCLHSSRRRLEIVFLRASSSLASRFVSGRVGGCGMFAREWKLVATWEGLSYGDIWLANQTTLAEKAHLVFSSQRCLDVLYVGLNKADREVHPVTELLWKGGPHDCVICRSGDMFCTFCEPLTCRRTTANT